MHGLKYAQHIERVEAKKPRTPILRIFATVEK
jgi:hypothetical protein